MSKSGKILVGTLILLAVTLGALLYRAETKMHDYATHVAVSGQTLYFDSHRIQMQIDDLDALGSDTGESQASRYLIIRDEFQRQNALALFAMAETAFEFGNNQDTLNSLFEDYSSALEPIRTFYAINDSLSDVPPGGIEELRDHYRTLKAVAERFETMNVDVW